jgi:hypothetical protein
MDALRRLAGQLEAAAAELAAVRPDDLGLDVATVDDGGPGAVGEVFAALRRQRTAALQARIHEVASAAEAVRGLASDLRVAVSGYAGADEQARSRAARLEGR